MKVSNKFIFKDQIITCIMRRESNSPYKKYTLNKGEHYGYDIILIIHILQYLKTCSGIYAQKREIINNIN